MGKILSRLINRCCLVYVIDVLIFGESIEIMIANLDAVLRRISNEGGTITLGKSEMFAEEIDFLVHTIEKTALTLTEKDISAKKDYNKPTSK
jgi:hypothetical protein